MNITIGNKGEYPLQWGMGAIEIYAQLTGFDRIESVDRIFGIDESGNRIGDIERRNAMNNFILAAIKNGCLIKEKTFDVNYHQVSAAIDEMDQDTADAILESFKDSKINSRTVREMLEPVTGESTKKKEIIV